MKIVIIGAGQAAVQLAASLRQEGHEGEIVLLGDEPGLPYQRPPLSKAYMKDGDGERLILKTQSFFDKNAIDRRDSVRVAEIDRATRQVTTTTGETIAYDHLVLATGARNVRPPIEGADHASVVELRTLAHAADIRDRMLRAKRAVVVGGGFIGLEFAAMAEAAGVATTVVEAAPRLMARAVSPAISERFKAFHRAAGTEILLDAPAAGAADRVVLADGSEILGDLVMVATGVKPNVELAEAAGLAVLNGITVDEALSTGDAAISAIGDCASVTGPLGIHLRLESVQAATDQARHLARRLVTGHREAYHAVPWFWSDQGSLKLQIAGLSQGADHFHSLGEEAVDTVFGFRAGALVSVETVNQPGQHMAARKLLASDAPVLREAIEAVGFDLKALAKGQASARAAE